MTADLPNVTFTTVKTKHYEMYENFTKPASITHETGIFTALNVAR
jgi:hypothetical protein